MYKEERKMKNIITVLGVIAVIALMYGASWCIVVGLIKLITMCFGITFSLKAATGVWLAIVLIKLLFTKSEKSK
jgi:hypothetical protein